MRHLTRLVSAAAAAGIALTACGGGTNVLKGKSPQDIVKLASTSVSSGSYHMALHGTVSIDTSKIQGLPPEALSSMTSMLKNMTMSGNGDVESPQRIKMTMSLKPLLSNDVVVVMYDGKVYVSQDGGKTYADGGSLNLQGLPITPEDQLNELKDTGQVTDQGATVRNGTNVEKIHAVISNDYINQVFSKLGGGGSGASAQEMQQLGQIFQQTMTLQNSSLDAYVRQSDGKMDSTDSTVNLSIDMGKFMQAILQLLSGMGQLPSGAAGQLPNVSGTMTVGESSTATFSGYGSRITVTQPTVDPNAPVPSGGIFGA